MKTTAKMRNKVTRALRAGLKYHLFLTKIPINTNLQEIYSYADDLAVEVCGHVEVTDKGIFITN